MKDNTPPRPGVSCDASAENGNVEVLPQDYFPDRPGTVRVGQVCFDRRTTLESPFFWVLVGGASVGVLMFLLMRERNR